MEDFKMTLYGHWDGIPSMRDSDILNLYYKMEDQDLVDKVFIDGSINNADEFMRIMTDQTKVLFFTLNYKDNIAGVIWLNRQQNHKFQIHFLFFKEWHGTIEIVEMGKAVLDYVLNTINIPNSFVDVVIGYIPVLNRAANMYMHKIGAIKVGIIPNSKYNASKQKSEDAVMYYATRDSIKG